MTGVGTGGKYVGAGSIGFWGLFPNVNFSQPQFGGK